MKKLLIVLSALFLLLLDGCGCSQSIDSVVPMHVSPPEYEKISCKQLNEQLNERLDAQSQIKTERAATNVFALLYTVMHAGIPYLARTDADVQKYKKKVDKEDSKIRRLKEEYEALKNVAIEKNCSFADDM